MRVLTALSLFYLISLLTVFALGAIGVNLFPQTMQKVQDIIVELRGNVQERVYSDNPFISLGQQVLDAMGYVSYFLLQAIPNIFLFDIPELVGTFFSELLGYIGVDLGVGFAQLIIASVYLLYVYYIISVIRWVRPLAGG